MNITEDMKKFVVGITPDATIRGKLLKSQEDRKAIIPRKYFFLTDLCDPLDFYLRTKYPDKFQPTLEKKKLFSLGNKIHGIMGKAIEKMDDFVDKEALLDGHLLGIPVRGKIDAEIKKSIFEFKSKQDLPQTASDVIANYPQDVEQLAFYSFLDPMKRKENYLVFVSQDGKYQLKAFKLITKSFKAVGNKLKKRVELLEQIEFSNGSLKCRYCYDDCILKKENLCKYYDNSTLGCSVKDFVEIIPDKEMEESLNKLMEPNEFEDLFSIFNIITPRKTLHESTREIELEPYESDMDKEKNKIYFEELFYFSGLNITGQDYKNIIKTNKIPEVYLRKSNFIKIGQDIYPCLIFVSYSSYSSSMRVPSDYKLGELSILSTLIGANKGYILTYYPNISNEIRAFEVKLNLSKEAFRKIKEIIDILKLKDNAKINELLQCPEFIHKKECPYKQFCE
jgi:hypothetical protein